MLFPIGLPEYTPSILVQAFFARVPRHRFPLVDEVTVSIWALHTLVPGLGDDGYFLLLIVWNALQGEWPVRRLGS